MRISTYFLRKHQNAISWEGSETKKCHQIIDSSKSKVTLTLFSTLCYKQQLQEDILYPLDFLVNIYV